MPRTALAVLILLSAATTASAQTQRTHVGGHIGVNTDFDDVLLGFHATFPATRYLELYPSFEVYFPDAGTLLGFNGDFKFLIPTRSGFGFYAGPGLNILYQSVGDSDDADLGLNLFGGIETRRGPVHPFLEARALVHDNTSFQLVFGLNFTLGKH